VNVHTTPLEGVLLVEPQVHGDARGYFLEAYHQERYAAAGIPGPFVQDNLSRSQRGVLRGLHFQNPHAQAKLAFVLEGEVFDVAVDVRVGSPSYGKWFGTTLSAENKRQLFIPMGFAHGFCVLSEHALFAYKCGEFYAPASDRCLRWDDPEIGIEWPIESPSLSAKDAAAPLLGDCPPDWLPRYAAP